MTPVDGSDRNRAQRKWPVVLGWALALIALAWVGMLILREKSAVADIVTSGRGPVLLLSVLALIVALGANGFVFVGIVSSLSGGHSDLGKLFNMHFVGQVVRYLPGRFWGVVYQAAKAHARISPSIVVRANLDQLVLSLVFNVATAGALILAIRYEQPALAIVFALVAIGALAAAMRWNAAARVALAVAGVVPRRLAESLRVAADAPDYSWSSVIRLMALSTLSWIAYLSGWVLIGHAFPALGDADMLLLAAYYSLAWVIGFAALLTPSGLGVREVSFVVLAGQAATEPELALLAVVVRLWILVTEVLLAGTAPLYERYRAAASGRPGT